MADLSARPCRRLHKRDPIDDALLDQLTGQMLIAPLHAIPTFQRKQTHVQRDRGAHMRLLSQNGLFAMNRGSWGLMVGRAWA